MITNPIDDVKPKATKGQGAPGGQEGDETCYRKLIHSERPLGESPKGKYGWILNAYEDMAGDSSRTEAVVRQEQVSMISLARGERSKEDCKRGTRTSDHAAAELRNLELGCLLGMQPMEMRPPLLLFSQQTV